MLSEKNSPFYFKHFFSKFYVKPYPLPLREPETPFLLYDKKKWAEHIYTRITQRKYEETEMIVKDMNDKIQDILWIYFNKWKQKISPSLPY